MPSTSQRRSRVEITTAELPRSARRQLRSKGAGLVHSDRVASGPDAAGVLRSGNWARAQRSVLWISGAGALLVPRVQTYPVRLQPDILTLPYVRRSEVTVAHAWLWPEGKMETDHSEKKANNRL
jgi:hypothetical protein